jgi:Putative Flp pilus-assembly TadE/G-like
LGSIGIAIDFATFSMKRSTLQAAADAAALAGAKQLSLASSTDIIITNAALSLFQETVKGKDDAATGTVVVDRKKGNVKVDVAELWAPFFAHFIGAEITPITVSATGALAGESKVCVLTLASGPLAFMMDQDAHIMAADCAVYANSTDAKGVYFGGSSSIEASLVCSGGGIFGSGLLGIFKLQSDCPPIADPLTSVPKPSVGICNYTNFAISSGSTILKPGTYCGGIAISGNAQIEFSEGEYIVKDGALLITDDAAVHSTNTVFYLTGTKSLISFLKNASIDLNGRETGSMAGLLFFEDPSSGLLRFHRISAANARNLTGTIYLPKGILIVDPNANVGQDSAYTAIVSNRLLVQKGPNLVLNSDYSATSVPVPNGIHTSSSVVLTN